MHDWKKIAIHQKTPLTDALAIFERTGLKICLVLDENDRLAGTVTDGDIRRGTLRSVPLSAPAAEVMNQTPLFANIGDPPDRIREMARRRPLRQIPILDVDRRVIGLVDMSRLYAPSSTRPNWAVLMAGGLGTRLRPLTNSTPKPMLEIGGKPVLELIIDWLIAAGFVNFYISVNYMSGVVKDFFGDGSTRGIRIEYLEETDRLGTAGSLSLITETLGDPLLVMNADLLTSVDIASLLEYHYENATDATMCVREYEMHVPFGVVNLNGAQIEKIDEKPIHRFFVNAGIYVLEPHILDRVPAGRAFDMPDLFSDVLAAGGKVNAFPIREYWIDIGQKDDLERAARMFTEKSKTT